MYNILNWVSSKQASGQKEKCNKLNSLLVFHSTENRSLSLFYRDHQWWNHENPILSRYIHQWGITYQLCISQKQKENQQEKKKLREPESQQNWSSVATRDLLGEPRRAVPRLTQAVRVRPWQLWSVSWRLHGSSGTV